MIINLVRCLKLEDKIIGVMIVKDKIFYSLELPYKNNEKNISSVPLGSYQCVRHWSRKFPYQHLQLLDVPNRSGILIHAGNTVKDTTGCILIGKGLTSANNLTATSRKAVDEMMELLGNHDVTLRISEAYSC